VRCNVGPSDVSVLLNLFS